MDFPSESGLTAYRIGDKRHPLFDGSGAMLFGGRWNSQGLRAIYASLSFAGAMLEILSHVGRMGAVPKTHAFVKVHIPQDVQVEIFPHEAHTGWDAVDLVASRSFGDAWLRAKTSAILVIPSVVAKEEKNILINPDHPDFGKMRLTPPEDLAWDKRLFCAI